MDIIKQKNTGDFDLFAEFAFPFKSLAGKSTTYYVCIYSIAN